MKPQTENRKIHIGQNLRLQIYVWSVIIGLVMLVGITFAWYTMREREAETQNLSVMKPYYLTLRNASETDLLQLAVGSLPNGKTRQIVFCVSNIEKEQINKDKSAFEYALELIHTDNLALQYKIYSLKSVDEGQSDIIVAEDIVIGEDGSTTTEVTYWQKNGAALTGTDVSEERHAKLGLTGTEINKGTYISYGKTTGGENGAAAVDNGLKLEPGEQGYASQYFLLEISWAITTGIEKYDKETDMIYLMATAVQPEPETAAE